MIRDSQSRLFMLLFILFSPLKIHFKRKMERLPAFSTGEKAGGRGYCWIERPCVPPAPSPEHDTRIEKHEGRSHAMRCPPLSCAPVCLSDFWANVGWLWGNVGWLWGNVGWLWGKVLTTSPRRSILNIEARVLPANG